MVTSAVNSSVKVHTWCKQRALICPQTVFSEKLALSFNKLFVKGCCNNRLSRHCCHTVGSLVVCFFCVIVFVGKVFGPSYEVTANLVTSVSQRTIVCVCSCKLDGIDVLEIIDRFFATDEVSEIWLTFSDPQMKKATKRLTSTYFMERYRKFLKNDGIVHLKTDSNFMFTYTRYMIERNRLPVDVMTEDLYHSGMADEILSIKTYYEQQWLDRGLNIKYIKFHLPQEGELQEPDVEIELDEYRSYNRSKRSGLQTSK